MSETPDHDVLTFEKYAPKGRPKRRDVDDIVLLPSVTRNTKLVFAILPMWDISIPPYALARFVALTRKAGFETVVFDYNLETRYELPKINPELDVAWESNRFGWWEEHGFNELLFPSLQQLLDQYIENILAEKPDILGLSLYSTNYHSTKYVATKIKEINPDLPIIVGGPHTQRENWVDTMYEEPFDYVFLGESEQNLLYFLEDWENGKKPKDKKVGAWYGKKRLNLDSFPFPDYSDFDLQRYKTPRATVSEFTRGCVARCNYCSEVWFWKFRDRDAQRVVDELEYQYDTYGHDHVYFADSLINGNIPEFKRFCELMKELHETKGKKITWTSLARADKRMDDEFFKLIYAAGGRALKYGFESGSQRVLDAMNKKRTVEEADANIFSAFKAGVDSTCLWIIGAPGEEFEDVALSLNFLWRNKYGLNSISIGSGLWDNRGTAYDNREKFNISDRGMEWLGAFYTLDLKNTFLNRFIRVKLTHMWHAICYDHTINDFDNDWAKGMRDIREDFDIFYKSNYIDHMPPDEFGFDYDIIKTGDVFKDGVLNEIWPFLRMIWHVRGPYSIEFTFDPEVDKESFHYMYPGHWWEFKLNVWFEIDFQGEWECNASYEFNNKKHMSPVSGKAKDGWEEKDHSFTYEYEGSGKW